jgi:hypothetical protein
LIDFASGGSDVQVQWKVSRDGNAVASETDTKTLPSGGAVEVDFSYIPVLTGEHLFAATGSLVPGGQVFFTGKNHLLVTDSTVSKADNSSELSHAFYVGQTIGSAIELSAADTLTSMELLYAGSGQSGGDAAAIVQLYVYDFPLASTTPGQLLYESPVIALTAADVGQWISQYVPGGLPLPAGRYCFSFSFLLPIAEFRSVGVDTDHKDEIFWENDGSGWYSYSDPFAAPMLRMNFNPSGSPLSAQSLDNEPFAKIFPSPATRSLTVEGQAKTTSPIRFEIFDALGRLQQVLTAKTEADGSFRQTFDVSGLPPGMLLVKMTDGEKSWWSKGMKQ